jgi:TonB-linked SusC/RagA family outer membrane protein
MRKLLLSLAMFLLFSGVVFAQKTLSGRVTDDKGNPLPNVSVLIKGTSVGTVTKSDGSYSLSVPAGGTTVVYSIVGQDPIEREIGTQSSISVTIATVDQSLSEVVVVAYGTAKKRTFTGSASTIRNEDINKLQISSFTRALEGTVAGVQVTSGSGQPGAGSAIRIRGVGSINASAAPLFVVDGVPYGGDFNSISSSDIESLSVLKDAASTALYGARGANGVILITTRRGKGKPKIEIQSRFGVNQRAVPEYDIIREPAEFLETYWRALRNQGLYREDDPLSHADAALYASQAMYITSLPLERLNYYKQYSVPAGQYVIDPATGKLNARANLLYYDDWNDIMYNNDIRQEHIATISGSSDKTQYYLSLGYLDDKGYVVKSDFDRITTRLRVDQEVTKWLKGGVNLTYARTKQNTTAGGGAYQNAFFFTRFIAPAYPVYRRDPLGNIIIGNDGKAVYDFGAINSGMGARIFGGTENPRATLDMDINNREAYNTSSRAYVEINPVKDLTITINHGVDLNNSEGTAFQNPTAGNGAIDLGRGTITSGRVLTENLNQLINYKPSFGNHNFDLLLGHESYRLTIKGLSANKQLYLFPDDPDLNAAAIVKDANSVTDRYTVEGFFSQLRYDWDNKYFISGSIRRDGSSRFSPENRWGNFWSAGLGWNISSEKFMEKLEFLNLLKLKFSIGEKGNDDLNYVGSSLVGTNYYPWVNQYTIGTTGTPNLTLAYRGNDQITWEKNRDVNYGIEFAMFKNRLTGAVEYFKRTTSDMLFPRPLALSTGIQSIPANIGDMYNQGIEGELAYEIIRTGDLRWNVSINATHWKNKITRLPPENEKNGIVQGLNKLLPGHSIFEFFTWAYAGVDQATGLSLWYMDELDGDDKPTGNRLITSDFSSATRYYTEKTATPDVTGGVSTQLTYKGFDLNILTSFGIGGWVYDAPYQSLMYAGGGEITTWHRDILKAWDPFTNGTETGVPKLQENYTNANATSDRWLTKADYLNIRNVTLGYTLPRTTLESKGITSIRLYILADNVWLNSRRQGLDPRQDFNGGVGNVYSPIRTISVGLNAIF